MEHSGGSVGDQSASRNADSQILAHNVLKKSMDSIGNWATGHSCFILVKKLVTFCMCPIIPDEAKFKSNVLKICTGDGLCSFLT